MNDGVRPRAQGLSEVGTQNFAKLAAALATASASAAAAAADGAADEIGAPLEDDGDTAMAHATVLSGGGGGAPSTAHSYHWRLPQLLRGALYGQSEAGGEGAPAATAAALPLLLLQFCNALHLSLRLIAAGAAGQGSGVQSYEYEEVQT